MRTYPTALAFPMVFEEEVGDFARKELVTHKGLTKREYFAAMALQGLCASGFFTDPRLQRQAEGAGSDISVAISVAAVDIADNLIKELNKQEATV
jgi:hypothetical protein